MQRIKQDILALIEKGETFHLECKKAQGGLPGSLWESYSAFCNTDGGVILLGVKEFEDKHFEVVGVSDAQKLVQDFTNTLNDRNKVSANVLTDKNVQIVDCDGKTVIVIKVPRADRADKPVYLNKDMFGQTYRRQNEGDYHVPKHIVRRMVADQFETFDNVVVPHTTFDDIDETTLKWYRNLFTARQEEHPFSKLHGVDFLRNIGGYDQDPETKEEGLTLAGLLMFGNLHTILRCVPEYNVDYREYSPFMTGVLDRWIDRDTTDFTWPGNLFSFFLRVTPKLYTPIKVPFKLNANMQRIDETAAHVAIREAMVNTFVHADYGGRMGIVVCKWRDRIEFRNPGTLRMPVEDAYKGWKSDCRNKGLQKMFQFLGYSEKAGSGFPKIFMGTDEQHWARPFLQEDFKFEQTTLTMPTVDLTENNTRPEGGVKGGVKTTPITVPEGASTLKSTQKTADSTLKNTQKTTDSTLKEIVEKNPSVTIESLATLLGITRDGVNKAIRRLKAAGVIRRVGPDKGGHWEIVKPQPPTGGPGS